uniref:Uncharacterized protein n=1 Tax=Arundo donax TaxID=35708 RepID=A0A0A9AFS4_ARUDO
MSYFPTLAEYICVLKLIVFYFFSYLLLFRS